MTFVAYQQGPRHLRPLPQFVGCFFYSSNLLVLFLGGPTCCLGDRYRPGHKAINLPSTHLTWESFWNTCALTSRLGWIVARLEVGLVLSIICILLKASVVVILLHLIRTVNDDPSNGIMPELLASS